MEKSNITFPLERAFMEAVHPNYRLYQTDCISGARQHLEDNSVDLIITDPPYGIGGDQLHKHYNRKEQFVLDGYVEVPADEYARFSREWIAEAERVLRPGGSLYIVSGYTHLVDILNALRETKLKEVNHLIWKYNFGVFTQNKYISSHYHLLYYVKPGAQPTFNTWCRYGQKETNEEGRSLNYADREDVWVINREYKPGQKKNKNELPRALLEKIILYSSQEGDVVADFFLGSFSTAKAALGLGRKAAGFELSKTAWDHQIEEVTQTAFGGLLANCRQPELFRYANQRKPWSPEEKTTFLERFEKLQQEGLTKRAALDQLSEELGRGYWALEKMRKSLEG